MWLRHRSLRGRTMGPPLDHHRHLSRRIGACPRPHHGCALPVLPSRRQSGGTAQGSRDCAQCTLGCADARRRPAGVRLRTGAAHYAQVDHQQRRDRRHLGALAGDAGAVARGPERHARLRLGGVADSSRGVRGLAGGGGRDASTLVGGAHRPAAGDRRLHRGPGRLRVPLRQALPGRSEGPRGGTVYGGEPVAAPRAGGRRERRAPRPRRGAEGRLRGRSRTSRA